jgi:hypothetical protein
LWHDLFKLTDPAQMTRILLLMVMVTEQKRGNCWEGNTYSLLLLLQAWVTAAVADPKMSTQNKMKYYFDTLGSQVSILSFIRQAVDSLAL